ncbi:hypothetical protein E2C01_060078 [Portunus trituberculatus]|uniref:Uncharacterized protein n=1 Tax=Portunus trituberculatus TaxID=210409 RepID=A0A5B7H195_PORTR|nr:hypothetical protein [Portunus trituberculatus]
MCRLERAFLAAVMPLHYAITSRPSPARTPGDKPRPSPLNVSEMGNYFAVIMEEVDARRLAAGRDRCGG